MTLGDEVTHFYTEGGSYRGESDDLGNFELINVSHLLQKLLKCGFLMTLVNNSIVFGREIPTVMEKRILKTF